jgi:UrcA family protein
MQTLIAIAALVAIAAPAAAQVSSEAPHAVINYSDLDLNRASGVDAMILRIRQAAQNACHGFSTRDLAQAAEKKVCIQETMAAAVKQVNAPLVSARYGSPATSSQLAVK